MGIDAWRDPVAAHRHLAYIPGDVVVWPELTGEQILDLLGAVAGGEDAAYRAELIERFNFDPRKKGRSYSKGNRQKIAIIAALMTRAPLLVMDEPTSGLDPLMEATFQDCLREAKARGQTILLSSHILSEVEAVCDRVAVLRQGVLVEHGTLAELRHLHATTSRRPTRAPRRRSRASPASRTSSSPTGRSACRSTARPTRCSRRSPRAGHTLQMREPSLEELFHAYYDESTELAGTGS
jgi:ABC-2 type transport system ATP-binding protein